MPENTQIYGSSLAQPGTPVLQTQAQANAAMLADRAVWAQQKLDGLLNQQSSIPGKGLLLGTVAGLTAFFAPAFTFLKDKTPKWRWGGAAVMGVVAFTATTLVAMEVMARRLFAKAEQVKREFDASQAELGPFPEQAAPAAGAANTPSLPLEAAPQTPATAPVPAQPSRIQSILSQGATDPKKNVTQPAATKTEAVTQQQQATETTPALQ